jgi:predicted nucleotidyltransferase component of viral defense system
MSPSLEYLERCSAETGYQVSPLEKVVRLGELAGDIARHPFLGEALALKGGTALNLCFGPPGRLSVDLDYNYIAHVEREKMLADRLRVEEAVAEIAGRHGYRVQRSADAFAGRKAYLRYRSVLGMEERIEVDLNFLFRLPIAGTESRSVWQPGGLDQPLVRVVGQAELLIGKLLALLDRGAARDAWDVAHLSEAVAQVLASSDFRARFIALSAILERPLPTYGRDRLRNLLTGRAVSEQLGPMLSAAVTLRPDELAELAWSRVGPLISLEAHEEEYITAIHRGDLRLDLLFPDDAAESARLALHPAILWKLENVRAFHSRTHRKSGIGRLSRDSENKD